MKKIISMLLSLWLLLAFIPAAFADDVMPPADDPLIHEVAVSGGLHFAGTTAHCNATISDSGKDIVATLALTHNGLTVGSWSGSGKSYVYISGTCNVVKGETYTLTVSGTSGGVPFSSVIATKTC